MWNSDYKSIHPGTVGVSLALEIIIQHSYVNIRPFRYDGSISVLVCFRGGVGLLEELMELVVKLWQQIIKAQQRDCHTVGKKLKGKVAAGLLVATTQWRNFCM